MRSLLRSSPVIHAASPKSSAHVRRGCAFASGPLADEDLRSVAIGLVVVVRVIKELGRAAVVVIVDDVRLDAVDGRGCDELKPGIALLDGLVELRIAAVVAAGAVEPVFVADLDVSEREGRGVAVLGSLCAPPGVGVAGHVFDLVERILHVRLKGGAGINVLLLHGVAGIDGEHGLDLEVFAPLQKFEQAHAVGGVVVPGADVGWTIDPGADCLLPLEALGDVIALEIIAAGQAQEFGMHGGQQIHQIGAETFLTIAVGWREDRDEAEMESAGLVGDQLEVIFCADGRDGAGLQREFVLLPVAGDGRNGGLGQHGACAVADQARCDRASESAIGFGIKRALIGFVAAHRHAPVAGVGDAGLVLRVGLLDGDLQAARDGLAGAGALVDLHGGLCVALLHEHPSMRAVGVVHEGAVADQLGIEAAIVGVIDLLGHEAVEGGADLGDGLLRIDVELRRLLRRGAGGGDEQSGEQCALFGWVHGFPFAKPAPENVCRKPLKPIESHVGKDCFG